MRCDSSGAGSGVGVDRSAALELLPGHSEADMTGLTRSTALAAAMLIAACVPSAWAGGDDYDAENDKEGHGPAYFGFVRDNRGSPVAEARVVLKPKGGAAPVEIKTNVLGLYRSHVNKDVKPDDVEISCEK